MKENLDNFEDLNENINYNELDEYKFIEIIEINSKKLVDYCQMLIENIYVKYLTGKNNYIKFPDCINFINPNSLNKNKFEVFIANFFAEERKHDGLREFQRESNGRILKLYAGAVF